MGATLKVTKASLISLCLLTGCASTSWNTQYRVDPFTDKQTCRVVRGTDFSRSFQRSFQGGYFSAEFVFENYHGQPRVGIIMEPAIPAAGDLQIRVDSGEMMAISVSDTPLDTRPNTNTYTYEGMPAQVSDMVANIQSDTLKYASPYRLATDDKAKHIIQSILSGKSVMYRMVGVNAALTLTGTFKVDQSLKDAVRKCGL